MHHKWPRKDILYISKRHLNRLAAQESELICDNLLSTTVESSSHSNDDVFSNYLENDSMFKSDIIETKDKKTIASENNITYSLNKNSNKSVKDRNNECRQLTEYESDSQSSVNISSACVTFENANTTDSDFKTNLAAWAVEYQIAHTALNALLQRLRQHSCFSTLSSDARSLVKTPRRQEIRTVIPGIYYHFGLLNSVLNILTTAKDNIDCIKIMINIDGLPLSKSSSQQFWPILGSIVPYENVFIIGIYYGNEKPADANDFLKDFVNEAKEMCKNGIYFNGRNIQFRIDGLICDTPAKAFILCVKGHSGYSSCTKCTTEGEYIEKRICFPQTDAPLRSDNDFIRKIDDNYHKPNTTCSLLEVPHFKPVTNVPLDYMHVICLGIMRRLIYLWLDGELHYRLPHKAVENISIRLITQLKPSIPLEFARKPRKLDYFKLWKATEYRLILLYTGPVAFKCILKKNMYLHFVTLHVIIRILSCKDLFQYLAYAQDLVLFFIKTFKTLYGVQNISHNVHSLVHLVHDVKIFGPLDNFSAFKFENYMQVIKKLIRKSDKPLQQVIRRCIEKEVNLHTSSNVLSNCILMHPQLMSLHCDGPLILNCNNPQYKVVKYNGITFRAGTLADNCCGLSSGNIVCIENLAHCTKRNIPVIIGYEFLETEDLFKVPCFSSMLGIYLVHSLSELKSWPLEHLIRKYVKLPCGNDKYAVFPLLHGKI